MNLTPLFTWWTGSALQVGIVVSAFWLALIVAVLALVGANRGRDQSARDVVDIRDATMPAPLHAVTAEHAAQHDRPRIRAVSS